MSTPTISDANGTEARPDTTYIMPGGKHVKISEMSDTDVKRAYYELLAKVGKKAETILREQDAIHTLLGVAEQISIENLNRGLESFETVNIFHTDTQSA